MLLDNLLLGAFPLLLTEYGLLFRSATLERLLGKWRPTRSLLRLLFWLALWLHAGSEGPDTLRVAVGFVLGELSAVALRRRIGAEADRGRPNGSPLTHFIPVAAGLIYALAMLGISRFGPGVFLIPRAGARPMVIAACVLGLGSWATMLTVSVIDLARPEQLTEAKPAGTGAGELIGLLERGITFVLVVSGALPAVGFVIAAKAAARFPEFKDKAFAEYFLIGTLTSAGLAVVLGLLAAAT